jgi:hypothetical protein
VKRGALVGLLLVAASFTACGGGTGGSREARPEVVTVPFRVIDGRIVVDVELAGRRLPMLLATGGRTAVSASLAGSARSSTTLSRVRLGEIGRARLRAAVEPFPPDSPLACASPHGQLGADFFGRRAVQVDFESSELRVASRASALGVPCP